MFAFNITLNYTNSLIDFYDWYDTDETVLIKKMPLFLVSKKSFNELICNKVSFSEKFYNVIFNKCEYYNGKKDTAFIISDGNNAFAIKLDNYKNSMIKSFMNVLDENEIVEFSNNLSCYSIDYKILNKDYKFNKYTRNSRNVLKKINDILIESKNSPDKLEYFYYEWFNKVCLNGNNYDELYNDINKEFSYKHIEFLKKLQQLSVNK